MIERGDNQTLLRAFGTKALRAARHGPVCECGRGIWSRGRRVVCTGSIGLSRVCACSCGVSGGALGVALR